MRIPITRPPEEKKKKIGDVQEKPKQTRMTAFKLRVWLEKAPTKKLFPEPRSVRVFLLILTTSCFLLHFKLVLILELKTYCLAHTRHYRHARHTKNSSFLLEKQSYDIVWPQRYGIWKRFWDPREKKMKQEKKTERHPQLHAKCKKKNHRRARICGMLGEEKHDSNSNAVRWLYHHQHGIIISKVSTLEILQTPRYLF